MAHRSGFTLIELSIVLVIVGLLAGGVLVGRDLIEAATIRSTLSQMEKYEAAVNTFRTKYNYLPGDMPADQAASTGLILRSGVYGDGNGDGLIESLGMTPAMFYGDLANGDLGSPPKFGGETVFFWTDLSSAGLIDGHFADSSDALVPDTPYPNPTNFSLYLPAAKVGRGVFFFAFHSGRQQPWPSQAAAPDLLLEIMKPDSVWQGGLSVVAALAVEEAFAIDTKIDDGIPSSGKVIAAAPAEGAGGSEPGGGVGVYFSNAGNNGDLSHFCLTDLHGPVIYNLAFPNNINCNLIIRTGI